MLAGVAPPRSTAQVRPHALLRLAMRSAERSAVAQAVRPLWIVSAPSSLTNSRSAPAALAGGRIATPSAEWLHQSLGKSLASSRLGHPLTSVFRANHRVSPGFYLSSSRRAACGRDAGSGGVAAAAAARGAARTGHRGSAWSAPSAWVLGAARVPVLGFEHGCLSQLRC
jgi:hypothetical protein